jgi:NAD(P)-dependent dehydrogenase (short-subunit alcohol dehydrogenase family)
VRSRYV